MGAIQGRDRVRAGGPRFVRSWGLLMLALLMLALAVPGSALGQNKPPPLPDCFETGSGYGTCQGEIIPGGGSVTKLIAPEDSKGDFTLTGPAPLQSTKPVACGDAGCVYNHLNWYVGSGAVAVRGCGVNQSVCEVRVSRSLPFWAPVYVRQNNDDKILWAIWNSGHPAVTISGTVDAKECGDVCRVVPLRGATVTANGPHGSGSASTDAQGHYKMTVSKGRGYRVTAKLRGAVFKPEQRRVDALGRVTGVDFRAEPECGLTLATDARAASTCRLRITMAAQPQQVELEANEKGKLAPKFIKVRVKIANPSGAPIKGVQLVDLRPVPADRTQQLDQLAFPRGALPVRFGTIASGADKVKTFDLRVTGDGDYVINALALFDDPSRPGGNGRAIGQGGKFSVKAPLLYFTADTRNNFVQDGDSWYVTGHVRNLSSHQTLCLLPLFPHWEGNAGGLGPHEIGVVPVDDPAPPLAGPLAPGQTISFLMRAQTEFGGGTTSAVALKPRAVKGEPGDACNVLAAERRPALSGAEVKLAKDSTHFQVRIDKYRSRLGGPGRLQFFGTFAESAYKVFAQLYDSGVSIAERYGSVEKLTAALGHGASFALSELFHAAGVAAWFQYFATDAEREAFIAQCVDDFEAKTHQVWDGVQTEVQQSVGQWLEEVSHAYFSGDEQQLFAVLGKGAGTGLTSTAVQVAEWELAIGLVKQTGAFTRTVVRAAAEESGFITTLKSIRPGRLLKFAEMQRLWGLAYEDYVAFTKIAKEEGVLIGVRSRAPISVKNLEEGAVWKHEELKPKNVSDIDIKYLGFEPGDKGLVAFRTYSEKQKAALIRHIESLRVSAAERKAILSRAETRFGEQEFVDKIKGLAKKGEIDVGFNYADNGVARQSTSAVRKFGLEEHQLASGETYFQPLQENPALDHLASGKGPLPDFCRRMLARVLCRVTGDMDGVYLTDLAGRALDEAKRIEVYNRLMAVGWQHPETFTWIKKGLFDFAKKTEILQGLELGGEAMMEFSPSGVRATFLKLADSKLTSVNDYFVAVLGGFTDFSKAALP
ncbi:MAG: hypothetical protein ACXVSL_16280 [Solirubrobacteraceae bacterium]